MADNIPWCYFTIRNDVKVKIDKEDLERVSAKKWRATKSTTGRLRIVTSVSTPKGPRSLTLGAFLMNPPKGKLVYPRRFNDGFDYRKSNLIVCTMQERQQLLPKTRTESSSRYRGVSYSAKSKTWRAGIKVKGKTIALGTYKSEDEAALAYNKAAREYFGDMAYQNPVGRKFTDRND
jgi:AP2-like factor, euAP2 lineage